MQTTGLVVALLLLSSTAAAQGRGEAVRTDNERSRLSVRMFGGWRELRGGDFNEGIANTTQLWVISLYQGYVPLESIEGGVPSARGARELGAEVVVHVASRIGIVGGVGQIDSSSRGEIETPRSTALYPSRTFISLRVSAVPLRLGVQFSQPVGRAVSLVVDGGVGVYFTHLRGSNRAVVERLQRTTALVTDVRGRGIGFHGGVSLDVGLSERTGLFFGVQGTRVDVGRLEGTREGMYSYQSPTRDEGTLRNVQLVGPGGFPVLVVGDGTRIADRYGPLTPDKDASLGLGGLRMTGGLRLSLW